MMIVRLGALFACCCSAQALLEADVMTTGGGNGNSDEVKDGLFSMVSEHVTRHKFTIRVHNEALTFSATTECKSAEVWVHVRNIF